MCRTCREANLSSPWFLELHKSRSMVDSNRALAIQAEDSPALPLYEPTSQVAISRCHVLDDFREQISPLNKFLLFLAKLSSCERTEQSLGLRVRLRPGDTRTVVGQNSVVGLWTLEWLQLRLVPVHTQLRPE